MTMRHVCSWQHQSTSEKKMGIEETPHGVYILFSKIKLLGKKIPFPQLLTTCYSNCKNRTQKRVSAKLCQKKRQDNPSRSLLHIKVCQTFQAFRLMADAYCYIVTLMTLQSANSFICHFSHFLEVTYLYFLLTQLTSFSSWVSEGVEDQTVIVFLTYQTQKNSHSLKQCKVCKAERYKMIVLDGQ